MSTAARGGAPPATGDTRLPILRVVDGEVDVPADKALDRARGALQRIGIGGPDHEDIDVAARPHGAVSPRPEQRRGLDALHVGQPPPELDLHTERPLDERCQRLDDRRVGRRPVERAATDVPALHDARVDQALKLLVDPRA
jgi:hypothetical protein